MPMRNIESLIWIHILKFNRTQHLPMSEAVYSQLRQLIIRQLRQHLSIHIILKDQLPGY